MIKLLNTIAFLLVGAGLYFAGDAICTPETMPPNELGDYVGGVSGSLWALAGVVFIYTAFLNQQKQISLQKEELLLNREELKNHRKEFEGQRKQMELQSKLFETQKKESTYFHLLGLYQSSIDQYEININHGRNSEYVRTTVFKGRRGIKEVLYMILKKIDFDGVEANVLKVKSNEISKLIDQYILYDNYHKNVMSVLIFVDSEFSGELKKRYVEIFLSLMNDTEIMLNYMYFSVKGMSSFAQYFDEKSSTSFNHYLKISQGYSIG